MCTPSVRSIAYFEALRIHSLEWLGGWLFGNSMIVVVIRMKMVHLFRFSEEKSSYKGKGFDHTIS